MFIDSGTISAIKIVYLMQKNSSHLAQRDYQTWKKNEKRNMSI